MGFVRISWKIIIWGKIQSKVGTMSTTSPARRSGGLAPANSEAFVFEQHEIVELLLGRTHVILENFLPHPDAEPAPLPDGLGRVQVQIEAGEHCPRHLEALQADRRKRTQTLWVLAAVLAVTATMLAGYFSGRLIGVGATADTPVSSAWRVVRVLEGSVLVQIGPSGVTPPIEIVRGGVLPDGSRLVGVDPARQIYSTPEQDVRIRAAQTQKSQEP